MPVPQFLTGLGLATKIGLGAATAAAVIGGAGVAGALPAPAQATFDTVTPFEAEVPDTGSEITDGTTTTTTVAPDDEVDVDDETDVDDESDVDDGTGDEYKNFGAVVSEMARAGEADGQTISEMAHAKNEARKAERAGDDSDDSDDDSAEASTGGNRQHTNQAGGKGRRSGN